MPASRHDNKATRRPPCKQDPTLRLAWHCDSVARPRFESNAADRRTGNSFKASQYALAASGRQVRGLPLGELHEARLFVNLSESAALRGCTARSVVVQGPSIV